MYVPTQAYVYTDTFVLTSPFLECCMYEHFNPLCCFRLMMCSEDHNTEDLALGQEHLWLTISVPGFCVASGFGSPCRWPLLYFRLMLLLAVLDILCFHIFACGSLRWIPEKGMLGQKVSRYPVFLVIVIFSFVEIVLFFIPIM